MKESDDELTLPEREMFASLPKEKAPPAFLEAQVVNSLKDAGLIRPRRSNSRWFSRQLVYAISGLLIFVFGAAVGVWWQTSFRQRVVTDDHGLAEFMLVLNSLPNEPADNSAEGRQFFEEYKSWAHKMGEKGLLVGGEKLENEMRQLKLVNGKTMVATTQSGGNESAIAGYFLIRAADYQQAIDIAGDCPHLKHGGTVEVRRIYHENN
jgi:hypothetical protein